MYIVSACLAGINSRYDGKNSKDTYILNLVKEGKAIPLCPEQLGGMSTPRHRSEIIQNKEGRKKVLSENGEDVTTPFIIGAEKTLEIAKILGTKKAILKSKSPSCGCRGIYDGTFTGNLIEGKGIAAELLSQNGIEVYTEDEVESEGVESRK